MLRNEGGKTFFKRVFIYLFLTMFIVSPFITAVSAGKDYNSSKSNTFAISKMEDIGINEEGIQRIQDAFDDEIDAYARYNDAWANTIRNMREVGMNDDEIKGVLSEIWISNKGGNDAPTPSYDTAADCTKACPNPPNYGCQSNNDGSYTCLTLPSDPNEIKADLVEAIASGADLTRWNRADVKRALEAFIGATSKSLRGSDIYIGSAEVFSKTITKVNWENIVLERAITEEGIQRIEAAITDEVQATDDYLLARVNTIARIKEAGITDPAKIEEILDALYRPILAADTIYDAIDQAMVDFPFLAKIFGNERMIVNVEGQAPFGIVTQNGKVESLSAAGAFGGPAGATMRVYTDMGTVDELIAGEITPLDALEQNKIRYEGVGLVNKIKFKVLNVVSGLLRKFINVDSNSGSAKKVEGFLTRDIQGGEG